MSTISLGGLSQKTITNPHPIKECKEVTEIHLQSRIFQPANHHAPDRASQRRDVAEAHPERRIVRGERRNQARPVSSLTLRRVRKPYPMQTRVSADRGEWLILIHQGRYHNRHGAQPFIFRNCVQICDAAAYKKSVSPPGAGHGTGFGKRAVRGYILARSCEPRQYGVDGGECSGGSLHEVKKLEGSGAAALAAPALYSERDTRIPPITGIIVGYPIQPAQRS